MAKTGGWEPVLTSLVVRGKVTQDDGEIIKGFIKRTKGKTTARESTLQVKVRELATLTRILRERGMEWDTDGIMGVAGEVRGDGFTDNHKRVLLTNLKALGKYLAGQKYSVDLKEISEIKNIPMNWQTKKDSDLLTDEQVKRVIDAGETVRDRCIMALLYDGGLRPVEARRLTWGDLKFDDIGILIRVQAKTDYERLIRLTLSVPYIMRWRENYPQKITPEAPVFVRERKEDGKYQPIGLAVIPDICRDLKEKTGIPVRPSLFRPSRITADVKAGVDRNYIMMRSWGNLSSGMMRVYAKPDQEWQDAQAFKSAGMEVPEKVKRSEYRTERNADLWKPITCPACSTMAPAGTRYCPACGIPLTERARTSQSNNIDRLTDKFNKMTPDQVERVLEILEKIK
ncbi:MAG: tyrosine-type recombinase/integrase [Methanomicrobiales archaeon]|jgi:integrase